MKKEKKTAYNSKTELPSEVPYWKRIAAYMVDWYLGTLFTSLPMAVIYMKATNTQNLNVNLFQYPRQYAYMAGGAGLLFAFIYYVFVPLSLWKGQTLGKRWCHFKIVKNNGEDVVLKDLLLRQVVGIFLIEGALILASSLFQQMLYLASGIALIAPLRYIGIGISILSGILLTFRKDHKAIHDLLAGTVVTGMEKLPNSRKEA